MLCQKLGLYLILIFICLSNGNSDEFSSCRESDLVIYKLIFTTYWTRHNFPKQYPENRPPAHWSKLVGMSHDHNHVLFRVGDLASEDFKIFAETGKIVETLKKNKSIHVLDEFSSSSINKGSGRSVVNFFADGNHSMVSIAVRIIPSPDWFVGIDSLRLCEDGTWVNSVTIEANPIDAGTDSGYTFTAPNWETNPQERITRITSKYPKHPANSFYYPKLKDLPVIAEFRIVKKKIYHLTKIIKIKEKKPTVDGVQLRSSLDLPKMMIQKESELLKILSDEKAIKHV